MFNGQNVQEIKANLFDFTDSEMVAHCISGDYTLGAGIAKEMERKYNLRYNLYLQHDIPTGRRYDRKMLGHAIRVGNIYNLITKGRFHDGASYDYLRTSLEDVRDDMLVRDEERIYIPRLGCGRDRLDWMEVERILTEVFENTPIEVFVCVK